MLRSYARYILSRCLAYSRGMKMRGKGAYRISTLEISPEHPLVSRVHAQFLVEQRLEERLRLCLVDHCGYGRGSPFSH